MDATNIRVPKLCRVPDLNGRPCGSFAVGRCTIDVDWSVCQEHWRLVANNGFQPRTFEQLEAERKFLRDLRRKHPR